ncbi:DUF2806 domain-containing protein [uncultured Formosa sp.]|uniref:DUF2806 domain-containing protein n=1 Tax=uncultured Formosa sp. TaxID=255435 RepID=UPI00262919D3|nr:DUF2806 domain-containing protein [uncultured Formosa sp.]
MPEINLIKFEGKPFEKLIDVISKGIGTLYKPRAIRKEAESKAYEIEIIEQAKSKALAEGKELEAETYLRIQERILFNEVERQKSIDNVVEIAAEQLKDEKSISEEPVDKDWSKRFFNIVQDVSDEEMQTIWGRILAGETKQPKSYSIRTLEFLKNLSKTEAEVFTKFADIRIKSGDKNFIFNPRNDFLQKEFGIAFTDKLLMVELGLIVSKDSLEFSLNPTGDTKLLQVLNYGEKAIVLDRNENVPKQALEVLVFTKIGLELSKLIPQSFNSKYIELICSKFKHQNVNIEYGDFIYLPGNRFRLLNKTKYEK